MAEQEYSITRTRESYKPRVDAADIPFRRDGAGNTLMALSGDRMTELTTKGDPTTVVRHLPFQMLNEAEEGQEAGEALAIATEADLPEGLSLNYRIDGGFNNNAIIVTWKDTIDHRVEWVCLKTFTGMQLKYKMPKKRNRVVFALADEDAFAYCNKTPCEECGFRCKSGFALYFCVQGFGIVRKPVERISMLGIIGEGGIEAGSTDHTS